MSISKHFPGLIPLALLALPCVEVFWLHAWVRETFGPNNAVLGFYSRDVFIPLLIGAAIALDVLHRRRPLELGPSLPLLFNLTLFGALFLQLRFWSAFLGFVGHAVSVALLILEALALGPLALFGFLKPGPFYRRLKPAAPRWLGVIGASALLFRYPIWIEAAWPVIGPLTTNCTAFLLTLFGVPPTTVKTQYNILLTHPDLKVGIGQGCAGLEGVFFFVFAFSLYWALLERPIPITKAAKWFVGGVTFLFFLNIFRIAVFFWIAVQMSGPKGSSFFEWAFHHNVGWFLYALGIAGFFAALSRAFNPFRPSSV